MALARCLVARQGDEEEPRKSWLSVKISSNLAFPFKTWTKGTLLGQNVL